MSKMNIRFNYLNESYYQKLEKIIKKIRNYTCPNCGGKYENETCVFCYATNNDLKNDIEILNQILINITNDIEILNINNIPINTLFNLLNSIPFEITSIKNFLNKYHYQENFDEFTNEILTKINSNDTLTALEINCLETLIYQNNNDKTNNLYNYFINNCARGKINVSFECYKLLIKQFVEKLLKAFYKNPKCIITDEQKEHNGLIVSGKSKNHKVWINSLEIEEMYKTGNYNLINTIFHELTHGIQYKNIFNGNQTIDPLVILEIKDSILSENLPNYYKENYNNISFEIEAQYYGLLLSTRYLGTNKSPVKAKPTANAICIGVTIQAPCPIPAFAASPRCHCASPLRFCATQDGEKAMPALSSEDRMLPGFSPKPKNCAKPSNSSVVIFADKSLKKTLHDCAIASTTASFPWTWLHRNRVRSPSA